MMSKQKLQSIGRKALIAVLLLSAFFLLREIGSEVGMKSLRRSGGSDGEAQGTEATEETEALPGSAQPLAAMVAGADGSRYGFAYAETEVMGLFRRFSTDFGEALGSAGVPQRVSEEAFRSALMGDCVFLRFACPQPLELLAQWQGVANSGLAETAAQMLCLSVANGQVLLWGGTEGAEYFCCETAASPDGLGSRIREYGDNGAVFAFEQPLLEHGGFHVIPAEERIVPAVKSTIPFPTETELDELLEAMGMNSRVASSYTEADGTVVYVDDTTTLRVDLTGNVLFHRTSMPKQNSTEQVSDAISMAWAIAEKTVGKTCGSASLLFAGCRENASGNSVTVTLEYAVNGIPVSLAEGSAAEIVLRGDTVLQARLHYRRCTLTEESAELLPDYQAAAISSAAGTGAVLIYAENGENLSGMWVRADG